MKLRENEASPNPLPALARTPLLLGLLLTGACAQSKPRAARPLAPRAQAAKADKPRPLVTMFPHSGTGRIWVSGQLNVISQQHGAFRALYSGANSLSAAADHATSDVMTLYTGVRLTRNTDLLFDVESAGGGGIGNALGLAGFTNLDVVRNPTLGSAPYVARFLLHQIIPLGDSTVRQAPTYLDPRSRVPARRIEIYAGRFSLPDFFDQNNGVGNDHLQFMNWTVANNGAWDYAADTRGYTWGAEAEYDDRSWSFKLAGVMMPKVANGMHLDANLLRADATNVEVDWQYAQRYPGTIRVLGYLNRGDMGSYADALAQYRAGKVKVPDVTLSRQQGRVKPGFGINWEQMIPGGVDLFGRVGVSQDKYESFNYTEVGNTMEVGAAFAGSRWGRSADRAGVAFVSNGISRLHQAYLAAGGLGFLLGDGGLNYGRETIGEAFYTVHLWRGLFAGADLQAIRNPGYNRDRGPVLVPGLRLHVNF